MGGVWVLSMGKTASEGDSSEDEEKDDHDARSYK